MRGSGGQFTRSVPLDLEPYRTQAVDYLFYFPRGGHFDHFPAHVARNETLVAAARVAVVISPRGGRSHLGLVPMTRSMLSEPRRTLSRTSGAFWTAALRWS